MLRSDNYGMINPDFFSDNIHVTFCFTFDRLKGKVLQNEKVIRYIQKIDY